MSAVAPVRCGGCGLAIDESGNLPVADRIPCASCGSTTRLIDRHVEDSVAVHSSLGIKAIRGRTGKVFMEQRVGDARNAAGRWVREALVIDREVDFERHHVEDGDGNVIYSREEKLSEHTGRGSDKPALRAEREARKAALARERAERKAARDAEYRNRSHTVE